MPGEERGEEEKEEGASSGSGETKEVWGTPAGSPKAKRRGRPTNAERLGVARTQSLGSIGSVTELWKRKRDEEEERADSESEAETESGRIFKRSDKTMRSPPGTEAAQAGGTKELIKESVTEGLKKIMLEIRKMREEAEKGRKEMKKELGKVNEKMETVRYEGERERRRLEDRIRELEKREKEREKAVKEAEETRRIETQRELEKKIKEEIGKRREAEAEAEKEREERLKKAEEAVTEGMKEVERKIEWRERRERKNRIVVRGLEARVGEEKEAVCKLAEEITGMSISMIDFYTQHEKFINN